MLPVWLFAVVVGGATQIARQRAAQRIADHRAHAAFGEALAQLRASNAALLHAHAALLANVEREAFARATAGAVDPSTLWAAGLPPRQRALLELGLRWPR